jgi:hypothetical protein
MKIVKFFALVAFMAVFTGACKKIQQLPDEPRVEFRSFTVFDTTDILGNVCKGGRLNFYFEDGDGDLGLASPEQDVTDMTDTTNLFLVLFRKTGGVMVQVPEDDFMKPYSYRIPYMESPSQNKILKGTVTLTFLYLFYPPEDNDTVRYDFYLKDRADHISNTESTCEIALSVNNIYRALLN